jgi:hypothetical protein
MIGLSPGIVTTYHSTQVFVHTFRRFGGLQSSRTTGFYLQIRAQDYEPCHLEG